MDHSLTGPCVPIEINLQLLNANGQKLDNDGLILDWTKELKPFGVLRTGISQLRLRKIQLQILNQTI